MSNYLLWLLVISVFVAALERIFPARDQPVIRRWSWSDALHLVFNGHFIGLMLYGIATYRVLPFIDRQLAQLGWTDVVYREVAAGWPLWLQIVVALFVIDFLQWVMHNLLHRNNFLWKLHQVHHSVKDGEMDWIVSFRFSWWEPLLYKSFTYLPLAILGFSPVAVFFHAVFGTLIGHLNHANLTWDYGPLRYLLNNPRMHLYHHDYDAPATGQNFGIIFSCWDWMFGTANLPDEPPAHIGFPGVEKMPEDYFGQMAWPVGLYVPALQRTSLFGSALGVMVLVGLYTLSRAPEAPTPMFGEPAASSQPAYDPTANHVIHPRSPEEAQDAMSRFGEHAQQAGWARPDVAVSAPELAAALSSPTLRILDVRTADRFEEGHIPSSVLVERSDYSGGDIPGVSLDPAGLQALLRARGVCEGDTVVLLGDGGPEPYRLWWTLQQVGGLHTRVLDGGLEAYKAIGERLAMGAGVAVEPCDVTLTGDPEGSLMWEGVAALVSSMPTMQFVDTRSPDEYTGAEQHSKAARAGHIPGAVHLEWTDVLRLDGDVPRLMPPEELGALLTESGVNPEVPMVTYCQSGTRSSALYYAAMQAGMSAETVFNYDGSWAEYSRLTDLPVETGTR